MLSKSNQDKLTAIQTQLGPYGKQVMTLIETVVPVLIQYSQKFWDFYKSLPEDQLKLIVGFIICFFGGVYPVLFAAIEAAKIGGGEDLMKAGRDLCDEAMVIIEANKKDDTADEDKDGKKDVDGLDEKGLILRKVNLVLTKSNPEKIDKALGCVYKVWLSVMAVLASQFAKTVALAASIGKFLQKPVKKYVVGPVQDFVPDQYGKWVPIISGWITKSIAISVAYFVRSVIVAFTSSLTGSMIMTTAIIRIMNKKGVTLGGIVKPSSSLDETYVDEVLYSTLAAIGFIFQFKMGFDIKFPFNILLMPLELAETFLRWSISK